MSVLGTIMIRPVLPLYLIILVVLGFAVSTWYTYTRCSLTSRQRIGLWAFRMGAVLIIAWLMLQAQRRVVRRQREAPVLAMILDVSASMTERLGDGDTSRAQRSAEFFHDERIEKLCSRYRLLRFELGAEVEEVSAERGAEILFNAPRSHIGTGINQVVARLHAENVAGLILLSDGLDHSGEALTPEALTVPMFIPELEEPIELRDKEIRDAWIAEVSYPRMMVVNWKANVDVIVRRRGVGAAKFPIHLRQAGRVLRSSTVVFEDDENFKQVSFSIEPLEVGQIIYQVEIVPEQDDDPDNNRRDFLIEVTDPQNRVLYLEGVPRWEFKFLKRALLSEKNYQLSAFVRGGDGTFINFSEDAGMTGGGMPEFQPETLKEYKVIVLGDMEASALDEEQWRSVRDFVDNGGGLLLLGAAKAYGSNGLHTAPYLEELMPAVSAPGARMNEGRFSVDLTATGRAHPALSGLASEGRIPPVLSFWAPVKVSGLSTALIAAADASPVLLSRRYGQGRVAMVLSDSLWRWQLAGGQEDGAGKSLYNRFVTQLIYWLAPSERDVEKTSILQALVRSAEVDLRERVTVGAIYETAGTGEEAALSCRIATPDGRLMVFPMVSGTLGADVGLGRPISGRRCVFTPNIPGKYEVTVSTADGTQEAKMTLLARESDQERTGAPIDRRYLQKLATETAGAFVQWKDRYRMFRDIPCDAAEVEIVEEFPIWNRWWWLVVLILLFSAEWWWRRRLDLV